MQLQPAGGAVGAWLLWGLNWDVLCLFRVVSSSSRIARLVCVVTEEFLAVREREGTSLKAQGLLRFCL